MKINFKEGVSYLISAFKNLIKDISIFINLSIRDIISIFSSNFSIIFLIYFFMLLFFPILNIFVLVVLLAFSIYIFKFILSRVEEVIEFFINPSLNEVDNNIYDEFLTQFKKITDFKDIDNLSLNKPDKLQNLINEFFKAFNFKDFFYYSFIAFNVLIILNIFLIFTSLITFIFIKFYDIKIIHLLTFKIIKFNIIDYLFIIIFSLLFIAQLIWYFFFPLIILKTIESDNIYSFYYNVIYIFQDLNDNNTLMFFRNLFVDIFWDSLVLFIFYLPIIILNLLLIKMIISNFIFFLLLNWIILAFFISIFLTLLFIRIVKNYYLYFFYL
ncbi:MAG: hypothetical protein N2485_07075 [bacterium]|nr:hypothetical protein [bacterium]